MNSKTSKAPYPPRLAAHTLEADFTVLPPHAPFPVLLQVRLAMQRIGETKPAQLATVHTEWCAVPPAVARQMAAALIAAADQAEKPHLFATPGQQ